MISQTAAKIMVVGIVFGTFLVGFAVAWFLRPTVSEQDVCERLVQDVAAMTGEFYSDRETEIGCKILLDGEAEPWMFS